MAFKPDRGDGGVNIKKLLTILNQTHLSSSNNSLYQFCKSLLHGIGDSNDQFSSQIKTLTQAVDSGGGGGGGTTPDISGSDFLTSADDSITLPNSRQLIAGTGVTFDDTVANQRTINVASTAFYDSPLTDGDVDETDLIFAGGDCIIVQVPI